MHRHLHFINLTFLHHSTETALVKVLFTSNKALVHIVLSDLKTAFDIIEHRILLQRLEKLSDIKETALSCFESCLSDRFQFVHINNKSSVYSKFNNGVPKGSVL